MAYSDETIVDLIQVLEDGQIQVRESKRVLKDGLPIATTFHRYVVDPGIHSSRDLTDGRLKAIAEAIWNDGVVKARKDVIARSTR